MKSLIVFDSCPAAEKIGLSFFKRDEKVYLFPLTSSGAIITDLEKILKRAGCEAEKIQSAAMINIAAEKLRSEYLLWVAQLPDSICYGRKNFKEFFAVDKQATLWWFSLVSEKNPFKSDSFNRLCQLDSIIDILRAEKPERIIFWCGIKKLQDALSDYASENAISFIVLPVKALDGLKERILKIREVYYIRHALILINFMFRFFLRTRKIKKKICYPNRASCFNSKTLLLITPYPNLDIPSAEKGIFKNKFYPYLQEAIEAEKQNITWILMYVENNSISFNESLGYAELFIKNGYNMFFLEEFISLGIQIKALFAMLASGLKYFKIEKDISHRHNLRGYNFYKLFRDDWYLSFAGYIGYQGILYYNMFKSLLEEVKADKCLHLCEMNAWEKALICAREAVKRGMSLYAYQSGTVTKMLLNYFNHPIEVRGGMPYAMPLPEKVICDGNAPYNYMRESGWPEERLVVAEAIRYNHLKRGLSLKWDRKRNVIFLAFSISSKESSSILNIAYEALKDLDNVEVWVKAHPFLRIEKVFELSGISSCGMFKVKNEPIQDLLPDVRIVIAGQSGVSIEALAYGCEVLIVDMAEWINMSPLKHIDIDTVKCISSAEELRQAVVAILKKEYNPEGHAFWAKKLVNEHLCLNMDSNAPCRFLELLKPC